MASYTPPSMSNDQCTQSNYASVRSTHIDFDWKIDWERRVLGGWAEHIVECKDEGMSEVVIFDTFKLDIKIVELNGEQSTTWELGKFHEVMGTPLIVHFPNALKTHERATVKIHYETTQDGTALQWLDSEGTAGKKHPYLFSQCQPIYCRAMCPVQDSSCVKITWNATISSPLPVLCSAVRVSPPSSLMHGGKRVGIDQVKYVYEQSMPVPSYLIAIASGNIVYKSFELSPEVELIRKNSEKRGCGKWTSGVWAEPEMIERAHWEFVEDTPKFILKAEELVGPYQFGVYELLVLPPAFPYGGMENPCITFLTPTILSGDRALVDVIAHELMHSWFGNGVTQANSSHFWLNEGWTTFFERVLLHYVHSPQDRHFGYLLEIKKLTDDLVRYNDRPKYQRLVIDFDYGEDPDDAYSRVPYDKGANFLLYLERQLGGLETFLPYVRSYVQKYISKSLTTAEWKDHLFDYWRTADPSKLAILEKVDWEAWFFGEGTSLPSTLTYDTTLADQAYALVKRWDAAEARETAETKPESLSEMFKKDDVEGFNTNQISIFLEELQVIQTPLPLPLLQHLGKAYALSFTLNVETRYRFYELALKSSPPLLSSNSNSGWSTFAKEAADWVIDEKGETGGVKGRMKFCRPIFRELARLDLEMTKGVWAKWRGRFHPIANKLISKDLGLSIE